MYDGPMVLGELLAHRASEDPDRELVRFADGALTAGAWDEAASRVARALHDLGLRQGDAAAIQLPNGAPFLQAWFGMARAGVVEVPLNAGLRGDYLAHALNLSEARLIVVQHEWLPRIAAVRGSLVALEHVVVVGGEAHEPDGWIPFSTLLRAAPTPPEVVVSPYDTATILFTSGTTGPSKGAVMTHCANFRSARSTIDVMGYGEEERLFTTFPLFHINAKYTTVLLAMLLDRGVAVVHDGFSASAFWDVCRAEGITAINFMGALVMMLHKQPPRPDDADNPVRLGFGAPAPVDVLEEFEARFGVRLVEVFGSTELGVVAANTPTVRRIGSCGRPVDDVVLEVHDADGHAVAPGVEGEIVVRPLQPHIVVERYHRMPEATLEAFGGLWFHTGDRGRFDADGWLYFVDRMKDAIRRRGENVSSWEVEQVLNTHPDVVESAVIGVPSELTEEEILAVVVARPGTAPAPAALLDAAQDRLPHFAVPRYVRFVDELPKNPQQRIEKFRLRAAGLTPDAWDREDAGYVVRR